MIDMQLLNDALMTVAFVVGLAIVYQLLIVAAAALAQRRASRDGRPPDRAAPGRRGRTAELARHEVTSRDPGQPRPGPGRTLLPGASRSS